MRTLILVVLFVLAVVGAGVTAFGHQIPGFSHRHEGDPIKEPGRLDIDVVTPGWEADASKSEFESGKVVCDLDLGSGSWRNSPNVERVINHCTKGSVLNILSENPRTTMRIVASACDYDFTISVMVPSTNGPTPASCIYSGRFLPIFDGS